MKCTKCGENIKPVVAIDIDGTLGDYHGHFLNFTQTYLDREPFNSTQYDGAEPFSNWCMRQFNIPIETYREIKLAYRQGGQKRSMPIFPDAREICESIVAEGAELWVTTTRPYLSLDGVIKDTIEWLTRHNISYDGLLFDDDKYKTFGERVDPRRVVAIFDDIGEMYDSAAYWFGNYVPWLVKGSWNTGVRRYKMCTLDAVSSIACTRIIDWRESARAAV